MPQRFPPVILARAIATYHLFDPETRDLYDGFAAGINRWISLHPATFPAGIPTDFNGYDVATLDIGDGPPAAKVRRFFAALRGVTAPGADTTIHLDEDLASSPDDGSNAWALAPGRTTSGKAILLRNPHLAWTAGYYEAHMTVPGVLDFYGDFRIGGPLTVIRHRETQTTTQTDSGVALWPLIVIVRMA